MELLNKYYFKYKWIGFYIWRKPYTNIRFTTQSVILPVMCEVKSLFFMNNVYYTHAFPHLPSIIFLTGIFVQVVQ